MSRLELKDTVELMGSSDYRDRFVAEYIQTKIRYERLKAFNTKIEAARRTAGEDNGVKDPIHACPAGLLREQQAAMGEYLHLLEVRAVIEDIDLADVEAWLEGKCDTSSTASAVPLPQQGRLKDPEVVELKITFDECEDDWDIVSEAVGRILEKGLCNDSDEEKLMAAALNVLHKVRICEDQKEESDLSPEEIKKGLENCISKNHDCNNCPAGQALKDSCECGEYLMRQALGCIEKLEEAKNGKTKD